MDMRGTSCHGLLHKPVKELAAMLRKATVEAESEFVEVCLQMRGCNGTLVRAAQPSLEQGDYEMDMVELLTRCFAAGGDDMRVVIESGGFEIVVDLEAISDNLCARFDIVTKPGA